mmetsp:Transcript_17059/g.30130  ORF Transcript_17059/g.30130 Transcript_17059/m.30130 type:complete len:221 (-) Transcript_17059:123-785(-)
MTLNTYCSICFFVIACKRVLPMTKHLFFKPNCKRRMNAKTGRLRICNLSCSLHRGSRRHCCLCRCWRSLISSSSSSSNSSLLLFRSLLCSLLRGCLLGLGLFFRRGCLAGLLLFGRCLFCCFLGRCLFCGLFLGRCRCFFGGFLLGGCFFRGGCLFRSRCLFRSLLLFFLDSRSSFGFFGGLLIFGLGWFRFFGRFVSCFEFGFLGSTQCQSPRKRARER